MRLVSSLVLCASLAAFGQEAVLTSQAEPSAVGAEPSAPPIIETPTTGVPQGFTDAALRVNRLNVITEGRSGKELSHRELFSRLGRTDLLAQSDAVQTRRTVLFVAAGAVAVAGLITGTVLLATSPNLATPQCENDVAVYNEICVPQARQHLTGGVVAYAGGVVGALVLGGLAFLSDPRVLDVDGTSRLVGLYNAQLLRTMRANGVTVVPVVTTGGAMMAASLRF